MNRVGYQGVVDKAKINILQLFHAVINRTNVDYAALLWIDEDYHSIKDDIPLVSVYTIGNMLVRGMLIPNEFLTKEIHATDDFKEYETVFVGVDVLMNQPQPVVSTQETHMHTPRVHVTPTVSIASPQGKKRKQIIGESSSPHKLLKITVRQKQVVEIKKDDDDSENKLEPMSHRKIQNTLMMMMTKRSLKPYIVATVIEDHDAFRSEVDDLVSQEFNTQAPKIIEEIFKNYVQSHVIQVHPTTTTSTETTSSADLQQQLYLNMKISLQDQANDPVLWEVHKRKFKKSFTSNTSCRDDDIHSQRHDDHQEDDAPLEGGEKRMGCMVEETVIDEDEVISKDETPELITELQNFNKHVPTIFDHERMEATLNDMLSNHFKNPEEYAYHLEQVTNFMENQIVWESRQ
nr:hypothetical protein [Tanacetum cinerariifolium]